MITRADIAAHLEKNIRTGFLLGRKDYSPLRSAFVREVPSDGAFEDYGDMGTVPWPVQNAGKAGSGGTHSETGAVKTNKANSGGQIQIVGGEEKSMRIYNLDWEIAIGVTHNAIDDDRAGDLEAWARSAVLNFERHKDYVAFDALNSGEAGTNYGLAYDNNEFFDNSHIDPGAEYQTAQDNLNTLTLSLDNFETVKVAGAGFRDTRGQPLGLNHNLLIVATANERLAAQISSNPQAYDTTNREMNPYSGKITSLVAPGGWLDSTAWFLIDPNLPQKPLNLQVRKQPELIVWDDETNGDGGTRYFKFHARYAMFYGDYRLAIQGNS